MSYEMEQIMPESGRFEEFWLPVEAVFRELTCEVIIYMLQHDLAIFKQRAEWVFSILTT